MVDEFESIANIRSAHSVHSMGELWEWIKDRKRNQIVSIKRIGLEECSPWFYDKITGQIRNESGSFFQIAGLRIACSDNKVIEQPIIIQNEIGFLGIICKKFDGTWHFLMQAKIEPGNINYVQISPTIQATKSNFTRKHGGSEPPYLSRFTSMKSEDILVDQIQSEQNSRFLGKRNRNVIIKIEDNVEETNTHRWMTLSQLKEFMKYDNLINMDTRTVLSCMPYVFFSENLDGYKKSYINSVRTIKRNTMVELYLRINNYKMFNSPKRDIIPIAELKEWVMTEREIRNLNGYPYKIIYCGLEIEGREVTKWNQPLFAAEGEATFGLICSRTNDNLEVLVQMKAEVGCFDFIEVGPTVQEEYRSTMDRDSVANTFFENIKKENTLIDVVLSEEGGRFYHEQNRNVILLLDKEEVQYDGKKYVWANIGTLNNMTQINNCINIQLRNLLMLLSLCN